ncbi:aspartic peptidase domain-containing protein [Dendryphion nanum]|uniref:Aspartic peptidase domain-containing protein n=1 Tax=Dendryphion nanum TaxID=256645 RepID=A0A9P9IHR3_9PLEO|nr:aspartic peptidase domain-containing protein [Dendryphion nanum]
MSNGTKNASPLIVENSGRWFGNDGSWSTFYVYIGTPPQHFHVLPSTKGQTLYVPVDQDCMRMNISDCGGNRGVEVFDQRPSLGFQRNRSSTWKQIGTYRLGMGLNLGYSGNGYFGYDTAGPSSSRSNTPKLDQQAVVAFASTSFWVGQFGLLVTTLNLTDVEQPRSFLSNLREAGHIPSLSFGYSVGAPYRFTKVAGSLVLGGYDRSRISKGANATISVPIVDDMNIALQSISSTSANGTVNLLDDGIVSVIDSSVPELWLPTSVCEKFATTFGLTYFEPADRYIVPEAARSELRKLAPTISLTLGQSTTGGETITIDLPYAAFDLQANYPIFGTPTYYFPIRRARNTTQYTIGRVLLQEAYFSVDFERNRFNISKAFYSSPMPAQEIMTIESVNKTINPSPGTKNGGGGGGGGLSTGAIAGIAVGGAIVLLLLGLAAWWFGFRKKPVDEEATPPAPMEEKKEHLVDDQNSPQEIGGNAIQGRTDLELMGRHVEVAEMEADHKQPEKAQYHEKDANAAVAEVEGTSPIYELPSP